MFFSLTFSLKSTFYTYIIVLEKKSNNKRSVAKLLGEGGSKVFVKIYQFTFYVPVISRGTCSFIVFAWLAFVPAFSARTLIALQSKTWERENWSLRGAIVCPSICLSNSLALRLSLSVCLSLSLTFSVSVAKISAATVKFAVDFGSRSFGFLTRFQDCCLCVVALSLSSASTTVNLCRDVDTFDFSVHLGTPGNAEENNNSRSKTNFFFQFLAIYVC